MRMPARCSGGANTSAGFYRRHYRPANLTLVVAGAIDPAVTLAQLAALFGAKHNDQEQTSSDRAGGMPAGPASIRVVSRGATPAVGLLVSVGAGNEGDYVLANMLGSMLAQG